MSLASAPVRASSIKPIDFKKTRFTITGETVMAEEGRSIQWHMPFSVRNMLYAAGIGIIFGIIVSLLIFSERMTLELALSVGFASMLAGGIYILMQFWDSRYDQTIKTLGGFIQVILGIFVLIPGLLFGDSFVAMLGGFFLIVAFFSIARSFDLRRATRLHAGETILAAGALGALFYGSVSNTVEPFSTFAIAFAAVFLLVFFASYVVPRVRRTGAA